MLGGEAPQHRIALFAIERVEHLLAGVDAVQRRHRHVDVAVGHQRPEMPQEQCAQERGDMQAVGIRVGEDADLVITQARQIRGTRIDTDGDADVVHFLRAADLAGLEFPGVQDLATQRHDGLEILGARLLGRATGGITFNQKQLGAGWILAGAVGQLARQCGAVDRALAGDALRGAQPLLRVGDRELGDALARIRMLVQPQPAGIARVRLDQRRSLARTEFFLRLPGELRVADLDRQHVAGALPDILSRELDAARQQVAELAKLAHRVDDAGAQTVYVCASGNRRNKVDVALGDQVRRVARPGERPFDYILIGSMPAGDGFKRQAFVLFELLGEVFAQVPGVEPFLFIARRFVGEGQPQPGAQHRLGLEHALEFRHREAFGVKEFRIGPETHRGAGVARADRADDFQFRGDAPILEGDVVFLATAPHPAFQVPGQRVHDRDADAVQAAGEAVGLVVELAAGVQARQDEFDAADFLLRVDVDRHAAPVIGNADRAVLVERNVNLLAVAGDGLIDAIVDDFMSEVIRPRGVGVHAGAAAHRLEA